MRFSFALIAFGGLLLGVVYANGDYSTVSGSSSVVEVANWKHPAKVVFKRNGITLNELTISNGYPVFRVTFAFDPQSSENSHLLNRICYELLNANGMRPYTLLAPKDHVRLNVQWKKTEKEMSIDFIPI